VTLHWLRDRRIRRDLAEAAEVAVVSEWLGQVMASLAAPAQTRTPPTMFAGPTEVVVEVADTTAPEERVGAAELVWFSRGDGGSTQKSGNAVGLYQAERGAARGRRRQATRDRESVGDTTPGGFAMPSRGMSG